MRKTAALLLCMISVCAQAQESFTKARIYKTDNQIIYCYIRNTAKESTPQEFSYSLEPGGSLSQITVSEILKVVFDDGQTLERYRIEVPVINTAYESRTLAQYQSPANIFSGDALIEKLVSGEVSLYLFRDRFGYDHFFYRTREEPLPVYLPNKTYSEGNTLHSDRAYKNLLAFLVQKSGCGQAVSAKLETLPYLLNPLVRIIREINNCSGGSNELNNEEYERKTKLQLGIMGGVSYTTLKFKVNNSSHPGLDQGDFKNPINPSIGAYLAFLPRHRVKTYVASLEVFYHIYQSETDSLQYNATVSAKGSIKFGAINIAPTIRFLFTRNKVSPFLEGGVLVNTIVSKKDVYSYKTSTTEFHKPIFSNKGVGLNGLLGAGVDLPRFSGHVRYQIPVDRSGAYFNVLYVTLKFNLLDTSGE